ncbi:MAG TPA: DoxX family membrane protein [Vicinamibacteria bacterium]|nr:DoxX family membrane protein [Vicinamibacteria bacterium]
MTERASDLGVTGRLQRGLLTLLRIAIGWHFLYEGHAKFLSGSWTSAGYLDASRWVLGGVFQWMASHPAVIALVDAVNVGGQILIGLLLLTGTLTRAASLAAIALLLLYYLANPPLVGLGLSVPADGHYLVVDRNLIELLALAFLAALPTTFLPGIDRWFIRRRQAALAEARAEEPGTPPEPAGGRPEPAPADAPGRRELLANLASLPFLGAFAYALFKKRQWSSYEERNLVDAVTAASTKTLDVASLRDLRGALPLGKIGNREFSRLILGGNLLSGWAHSRDLIYVSQLVKAYHNKERIFATLLMAEKCGINTLLTNPILCTLIDEYWKRRIGRIQFISDCAGLDYDEKGARPTPFDKYLDKVRRAVDYGAVACYIQGETADYYVKDGQPGRLAKVIDLVRRNGVLVGIGAHHLETLQGCVAAGMTPDFWMKTMHHHGYWSARHPEWHDNLYCNTPAETAAWMRERKEPWIAFKTMAAGAIHPKEAFRYAWENGADFVCAGMYDFQLVEDVNVALDALGGGLPNRQRPWMA